MLFSFVQLFQKEKTSWHSLLVLFSDALAENLSSKSREKNCAKFLGAKLVPENSDPEYSGDGARFFLVAFSCKKKRRGAENPFVDNFQLNIRNTNHYKTKTKKCFCFECDHPSSPYRKEQKKEQKIRKYDILHSAL